MIREILKEYFPIESGLGDNQIDVNIETKNATFSLSDEKACSSCNINGKCNKEVLIVNNNAQNIDVVDFETYITKNYFAQQTKVCDKILADKGGNRRKIMFCELTCMKEQWVEPNTGKYPQGKRARAREQMNKSIELLLEKTVTSVNILTFTEKICLFAWRDPNVPNDISDILPERKNVRSNMLAMMKIPSNMATQTTTHHEKMNAGFQFMQIKYPREYNW